MPHYLRRGVSALGHTYLAITLGFKMEVGAGIEPTSADYKSTVLPLNYPTVFGCRSWTRTSACGSQSPVPYQLGYSAVWRCR